MYQGDDSLFLRMVCNAVQELMARHFTMARVCSAQRLLGVRCKEMGSRLALLCQLMGENSLCSCLSMILNDIMDIATSHLIVTSRTIHTPTNPYLSTSDFFPNFPILASVLARELEASTKVLTTVMTDTLLLENMEIVALSLRRQHDQLKKV